MASMGKAPERGEGYSESTVYMRMTRLDKSMRWIWRNETDGFTLQIHPAHADAYMEYLAQADYGRSYKADLQKAIKTLFRYREADWNPEITFSDPPSSNVTNRILTLEEWRAVRDAAADYGAWIDYHTVSPQERSALNKVLAQRLGKAPSAVGPADWQDAPSYKFASMFWLGMDGGLRPAMIGRMRLHWIDLENQMIHIPGEHAVKNNED
jgi:integrase